MLTEPFAVVGRHDDERAVADLQLDDSNVTLPEVLAEYVPVDAKPNLVPTWLDKWLELKRREVEAGDRSPTYLRELERYARPAGSEVQILASLERADRAIRFELVGKLEQLESMDALLQRCQ